MVISERRKEGKSCWNKVIEHSIFSFLGYHLTVLKKYCCVHAALRFGALAEMFDIVTLTICYY